MIFLLGLNIALFLVRVLARQVAHQGHRLVVDLAVDDQKGEGAGGTSNSSSSVDLAFCNKLDFR